MRKNLLVATILIVGAPSLINALPNQVISPKYKVTYLKGVQIMKDCTGKTDYPHLSKHVPGTVNVEATIKCPGREVTIDLTLIRKTLKGRKEIHRSAIGNSKMTINVAMKCTWKRGVPFRYIARAVYTEASGATAKHVVFRDLYC
jgi:hypothetical protein